MRIPRDQVNEDSLAKLANKAVRLLDAGDFRTLANQYGYALAFDRKTESAISDDFKACLSIYQAKRLSLPEILPFPKVAFFDANNAGIFATVECVAQTENGQTVMIEFVITTMGEDHYLTLEQIS